MPEIIANNSPKREGRVCAREGCGKALSKHASRANFCSPECAKAARAEIEGERPSVKWRALTEGEPRAIYSGGQDRLGHICLRSDGAYVAFDKRQIPIGTYDSAHEATQAVVRRAWSGAS
jgi:hypothetical protein